MTGGLGGGGVKGKKKHTKCIWLLSPAFGVNRLETDPLM